ncbi:MT-A70-domain-containing protein [Flammula alnicola]|nr:MT-A70-domain-containing protein [Flammula alnicola]
MLDDELKIVATMAFKTLIASRKINTPTTSMDLLTSVMTTEISSGLLPNSPPPRFRLTDLARFERIIEDLSNTWTDGVITFSRDDASGKMMIWELSSQFSGSTGQALLGAGLPSLGGDLSGFSSRKRKRVIDEDADSAAGDDETLMEEDDAVGASSSTLANLNAEMREVYTILQRSTAKGRLLAEQFRSREENFDPICSHITKDDCARARRATSIVGQSPYMASGTNQPPPTSICDRVHFRPLIRPHTDITLGHCSYLNTCYSEPTYAQSPSIHPFFSPNQSHGAPPNTRGPVSLPSGLGAGGRGKEKAPCRYLHYEIDWDGGDGEWQKEKRLRKSAHNLAIGMGPTRQITKPLPPQWINCDLRTFDYSTLGKFHVIMADPPWDIHMSLPYGTMNDDEMRKMPIPMLQDEGFLFLWVTGRAMEVGRECLRVWGYTRVDEVVWVKTNQLQRVIRTGRTGHWLNHTKEHMLVGVKTVTDANGALKFPSWANRALDTDVIVSEVRETSRKPEEVYGLIERLCPGGRKVEIFGRKHNARPGWLTLGNQLGPDQIYEEDLALRIKAKYVYNSYLPPYCKKLMLIL